MKRCSKKTGWNQWRQVKFKGTMTKWPLQKQTFRTAQNAQNNKTLQTLKKTNFVSIELTKYSHKVKLWSKCEWQKRWFFVCTAPVVQSQCGGRRCLAAAIHGLPALKEAPADDFLQEKHRLQDQKPGSGKL